MTFLLFWILKLNKCIFSENVSRIKQVGICQKYLASITFIWGIFQSLPVNFKMDIWKVSKQNLISNLYIKGNKNFLFFKTKHSYELKMDQWYVLNYQMARWKLENWLFDFNAFKDKNKTWGVNLVKANLKHSALTLWN